MSEALDFWVQVEALRERDPRFAREAYGFVMAGLGRTVDRLPGERRRDPARRHLTGQELLAGLLDCARKEFGYLAYAVFTAWGVRDGRDFGAIVFQLVEAGVLSRRPEDRIEDFEGGPDLRSALVDSFPWASAWDPPPAASAPRGRAAQPKSPGHEA